MLTSFDLGALEEKDHSLNGGLSFDLGALEEKDQSLNGGYMVIYDKEVPIELRLVEENKTENDEAGTLESIKTKILIQGEIEAPECVKVELTSEADLFFHYSCM